MDDATFQRMSEKYAARLRGLGWTAIESSNSEGLSNTYGVYRSLSVLVVYDHVRILGISVDERTKPHNHPIRVRSYREPEADAILGNTALLHAPSLLKQVNKELKVL